MSQIKVAKRGKIYAVIAVAVAALCALPVQTFAEENAICNVRGVMGNVRVLQARDRRANANDKTTWPEARLNMPLRAGDRIATFAESEVRLELADGSTVRLRAHTDLEIAQLSGGANAVSARLSLRDGGIVANVQRLAGGRSHFELETPTSLAAIRGTTVELVSRGSAGTTLKTFDGNVAVTTPSDRRMRNAQMVGNYQMTEMTAADRIPFIRRVPSFYRARTTRILSEIAQEDPAALRGFTRVILTTSELEEVQRMLENDNIPSAVGIGESDNLQTARTVSADNARTELAISMGTQVQRLSESYAQNIEGQARTIWEESVRQITDVTVRGTSIQRSIIQHNQSNGQWRVYTLMVLDPSRLRNVMTGVTDRMESEQGLRVRRDEMMSRMDASIEAYNTRYHDR